MLDSFQVLRQYEGVPDVFRNPIVLRPLEIMEYLILMLCQARREILLELLRHFSTAAAAREALCLIDLLHE